ncbi:unnamed protein product [Bursaphelenchus okinawaensis]|uniref:Uncharacterized protein n=1 Tax=Bursaphelenchus okinawaensis TaxID=465554 RepID=A0A811KC46_9BILA|nr:unnamed protein product [Bursaphelenchus okinawaensis]CAG9096218.1 unnamed protein product [Bursaphelenchus okinawaensis]
MNEIVTVNEAKAEEEANDNRTELNPSPTYFGASTVGFEDDSESSMEGFVTCVKDDDSSDGEETVVVGGVQKNPSSRSVDYGNTEVDKAQVFNSSHNTTLQDKVVYLSRAVDYTRGRKDVNWFFKIICCDNEYCDKGVIF